LQPEIANKLLNTRYFCTLMSFNFKVIDVAIPGKLVNTACYVNKAESLVSLCNSCHFKLCINRAVLWKIPPSHGKLMWRIYQPNIAQNSLNPNFEGLKL